MSNLTIFRKYVHSDPTKLPGSLLFSHSKENLVIFDKFPKALYHLLILPRTSDDRTPSELSSLRSLLKGDREKARSVIHSMNEEAKQATKEVEEEMVKRHGFKWTLRRGFHAVQSMDHLHLHLISEDYLSDCLKNKKHYNSFHPKLGFFLDVSEVISWFDADPSYFSQMARLESKEYEPLLKEDLVCWRCNESQKNMPNLKAHLQKHFDDLSRKEKARSERKRKAQENETKKDEKKLRMDPASEVVSLE